MVVLNDGQDEQNAAFICNGSGNRIMISQLMVHLIMMTLDLMLMVSWAKQSNYLDLLIKSM